MKTKRAVLLVRVSTSEQDVQRQIDDLKSYASARGLIVTKIITEKISGALKNEEREGIQQMLTLARNGEIDCIVVSELSRMSRNAFQLQRTIEELTELRVSVLIQSMNVETLNHKGERTPVVDLLIAIIAQIAQMERVQLIDRVKSGMACAKAKGIHCGRPKGTEEDSKKILSKYPKVVSGLERKLSIREIAKLNNISSGTVLKVKKYVSTINKI